MITSPNAPAVRTILISVASPSATIRGLTSYTIITPDNYNTCTATPVYLFYAGMSNLKYVTVKKSFSKIEWE